MASRANPGNRGTTQTGYGRHEDRRTKRQRTRSTRDTAAVEEWSDAGLAEDPAAGVSLAHTPADLAAAKMFGTGHLVELAAGAEDLIHAARLFLESDVPLELRCACEHNGADQGGAVSEQYASRWLWTVAHEAGLVAEGEENPGTPADTFTRLARWAAAVIASCDDPLKVIVSAYDEGVPEDQELSAVGLYPFDEDQTVEDEWRDGMRILFIEAWKRTVGADLYAREEALMSAIEPGGFGPDGIAKGFLDWNAANDERLEAEGRAWIAARFRSQGMDAESAKTAAALAPLPEGGDTYLV